MARIERFEEIEAWKTARKLANYIYDLTEKSKFARDFGLRDQIQRASVSVMSNIAEGFEGQSNRGFISYLYRAKASAGEVRSQLYIAFDRKYISGEELDEGIRYSEKASRLLYRFIEYLKSVES